MFNRLNLIHLTKPVCYAAVVILSWCKVYRKQSKRLIVPGEARACFSIETLKAVCNGPLSSRGCVVCMEQCESAAALLESVREQEVQFEQLTRALEEERRRVGLPATSPSALGRPLPHPQVTLPNKPSDPHPDFLKLHFSHNTQRVDQLHWGFSPLSH